MSKEKYKEIMSENDLVPVSLLFCLCTVYGKEKETVHALIAHSFEHNINLKLDKVVLRSIQVCWISLRRIVKIFSVTSFLCNFMSDFLIIRLYLSCSVV